MLRYLSETLGRFHSTIMLWVNYSRAGNSLFISRFALRSGYCIVALPRTTYTTRIRGGGGGGRGQSRGQHGLLYSTPTPRLAGDLSHYIHSSNSMSLGTYVWMFHAFFNHFYSSIFEIALWMTVLSSPYIAQEPTAYSAMLSVRLERFALCLKERHRSQNQGSLKSEKWKSVFKEWCGQLYTHNFIRFSYPIPRRRVRIGLYNRLFTRSIVTRRCSLGYKIPLWGKGLTHGIGEYWQHEVWMLITELWNLFALYNCLFALCLFTLHWGVQGIFLPWCKGLITGIVLFFLKSKWVFVSHASVHLSTSKFDGLFETPTLGFAHFTLTAPIWRILDVSKTKWFLTSCQSGVLWSGHRRNKMIWPKDCAR